MEVALTQESATVSASPSSSASSSVSTSKSALPATRMARCVVSRAASKTCPGRRSRAASSAHEAMTAAYPAISAWVKKGAMSLRCRRHSSPSPVKSPSPASGLSGPRSPADLR